MAISGQVVFAGVSKAVARVVKDDYIIGAHTKAFGCSEDCVVLKVAISKNTH